MYFITDWVERVDFARMRHERLARAREAMRANEIDLVLAFKYENVRYLSGLRPLWFPIAVFRSAALATPDPSAPVICFVTIGDWQHRRATMHWLDPANVRPLINYKLEEGATAKDGLRDVADAVRELGAADGRIAVDQLTLPVLDALRDLLPNATFIDANDPLQTTRMVKTRDEVTLFRFACEAVDEGLAVGIAAVKPGRRECEILGEVMKTFYGLGMEIPQCSLIVASGENLNPLQRFAGDRKVREGDLVFMDVGGCFNGVFAEGTRVVACGKPSPEQRRTYQAVFAAQQALFAAVKPGISSDAICRVATESYQSSGMAEFSHDAPIGHGIGLGGIEPPILGSSGMMGDSVFLQENMTLSIEPTISRSDVPGGATVRLEDEIVVTADGCEVLTRAPYDEHLLT